MPPELPVDRRRVRERQYGTIRPLLAQVAQFGDVRDRDGIFRSLDHAAAHSPPDALFAPSDRPPPSRGEGGGCGRPPGRLGKVPPSGCRATQHSPPSSGDWNAEGRVPPAQGGSGGLGRAEAPPGPARHAAEGRSNGPVGLGWFGGGEAPFHVDASRIEGVGRRLGLCPGRPHANSKPAGGSAAGRASLHMVRH